MSQPFLPFRSRVPVLLALTCVWAVACQEYALKLDGKDPKKQDDSGSSIVDTSTGDTAQDSAHDTGTVVVPDTGDTGTVATASVYLNTSDTLFAYDPSTNTASRIGNFTLGGTPFSGMTDIAIDLSGYMFGGTSSSLYAINPSTAECTFVARLADSMIGLTFVSDGRLVGAGSRVSFVDTSTGALTQLVPSGRYSTSGDIIGLPDGMLYWTVSGGDDLVRVDPGTGATTRVGSIGTSGLYGLGYADGVLMGFADSGRRIDIDASTARSSNSEPLPGSWWGATTNPVLW